MYGRRMRSRSFDTIDTCGQSIGKTWETDGTGASHGTKETMSFYPCTIRETHWLLRGVRVYLFGNTITRGILHVISRLLLFGNIKTRGTLQPQALKSILARRDFCPVWWDSNSSSCVCRALIGATRSPLLMYLISRLSPKHCASHGSEMWRRWIRLWR